MVVHCFRHDRRPVSNFPARAVRNAGRGDDFSLALIAGRKPMALSYCRGLLVEPVVNHFLCLSRQHRFCRCFLFAALRLAIVEGQIARGGDCPRSEFVDQTPDGAGDSSAVLFHF